MNTRSINFECQNQVESNKEIPPVTSQGDAKSFILLVLRNYAGEEVKIEIEANKRPQRGNARSKKSPST